MAVLAVGAHMTNGRADAREIIADGAKKEKMKIEFKSRRHGWCSRQKNMRTAERNANKSYPFPRFEI